MRRGDGAEPSPRRGLLGALVALVAAAAVALVAVAVAAVAAVAAGLGARGAVAVAVLVRPALVVVRAGLAALAVGAGRAGVLALGRVVAAVVVVALVVAGEHRSGAADHEGSGHHRDDHGPAHVGSPSLDAPALGPGHGGGLDPIQFERVGLGLLRAKAPDHVGEVVVRVVPGAGGHAHSLFGIVCGSRLCSLPAFYEVPEWFLTGR